MRSTDIMRGSPPVPEAQVTRANWRSFPAIRWGFTHTREVLPTAEIRRSAHPTPMRSAPRELVKLGFTAPDGKATTIEAALLETFTDALLVMHRGTLIHEWYGEGMSATTPHLICSISKALAGTLGGVLAARDVTGRVLVILLERDGDGHVEQVADGAAGVDRCLQFRHVA